MKYYYGIIALSGDRISFHAPCLIVATNEANALEKLNDQAAYLYGKSVTKAPGVYHFEDCGYTAVVQGVAEMSASSYQEMARLSGIAISEVPSQLAEEDTTEQVRTLARRVGSHLAHHGAKVPHSKLLHAIAASIGETDWQVLTHRHAPATVETLPSPALETTPEDSALAQPKGQPFIPGTGFLYEVPVTVDVTASAFIKVRAATKHEAIALAREFAADGHIELEMDEGNYRRPGDYYVGDKDILEPLDDDEPPTPDDHQDFAQVQRGAYRISLVDADDDMYWAELDVFDPNSEEPIEDSHMTCLPMDASPEEIRAFCVRVVELLHRGAPKPADVEESTILHAFTCAVQGDQSDEAFASYEQELRKG